MGGGRPSLLVFLMAAIFLAGIPYSSSAASSNNRTVKPKNFPPPPQAQAGGRAAPASAVFPVYGDVYPHGLYYVAMNIGEPPKPYFLDVDTGSDLTWLQCDAPCVRCSKCPHPWYRPERKKLVPCKDPLCAALLGTTSTHDQHCEADHQCDYEIEYADRGSSLGVLVTDAFSLRLTNSSLARPFLSFGCGYDQQFSNPNLPSPTDGVLGLGSGKVSILSQLSAKGVTRNVVGHCFSRRGGGYLFFGDDLVPASGVTWAPMSRSAYRNYYSPGPASLYLGGRSLGAKQVDVVVDSGSSYTYFAFEPYQAFLSAVKNDLAKMPLKEAVDDPSLPLCWRAKKPFRSVLDIKKYFKTLVLNFVGGKRAMLEIPPENYMVITKHGNACLGILNGTEVGLKDLNIIGDVSLQDLMVVYDNEKQQIGWVRANCDRLPKSGTSLL